MVAEEVQPEVRLLEAELLKPHLLWCYRLGSAHECEILGHPCAWRSMQCQCRNRLHTHFHHGLRYRRCVLLADEGEQRLVVVAEVVVEMRVDSQAPEAEADWLFCPPWKKRVH